MHLNDLKGVLDAIKMHLKTIYKGDISAASRVLGSFCSNKSITCTSKFHDNCVGCKLGKIHQLPVKPVEHVSPYPLYKIHSDLWQSPVLSNQLYRILRRFC